MKYDVFTVGDPTLDLIFTGLPQLPRLGEDTLANGFEMVPGEAYNTAVGLHRLGVKVAWAADFGNDPISQLVLQLIRKDSMDESFFVHHDRPFRRLSASFSFPEDRGFISYYDPSPGIPAALAGLAKVNARCFFVPGLFSGSLLKLAIPIIKAKNFTFVMDGNCNESTTIHDKAVREVISRLDIFMPNKKEALMLTGQTEIEQAGEELGKLCPLVVIKSGRDGSYAYQRDGWLHEPSISVDPVDTTGAGDMFDAGFLAGWLNGHGIGECLRWGNICAGLSTLGHGSSGFFVSREELDKHLNKCQTENYL